MAGRYVHNLRHVLCQELLQEEDVALEVGAQSE
jgi:hypothetical protein